MASANGEFPSAMNHEFQDHPAKLADREPPLGTGNMTQKKTCLMRKMVGKWKYMEIQ